MRLGLFFIVFVAGFAGFARAQDADPLTVMLPTGKVVHFQTPEQKAKYEAALARRQGVAPPAAPVAADSSAAAGVPFVSLEVTGLSSGANYHANWITDYGSYDVTGKANRALSVKVVNLSQQRPASVVVHWYFFAHPGGTPTPFIFDAGEKALELGVKQDVTFALRSADLTKRVINYALSGMRQVTGAEMEGWLVTVTYEKKALKVVGSKSQLETLYSTPAFADLLAAYKH